MEARPRDDVDGEQPCERERIAGRRIVPAVGCEAHQRKGDNNRSSSPTDGGPATLATTAGAAVCGGVLVDVNVHPPVKDMRRATQATPSLLSLPLAVAPAVAATTSIGQGGRPRHRLHAAAPAVAASASSRDGLQAVAAALAS